MNQENEKDTLWEIKITQEECSYKLYLISPQRPLVIKEKTLDRFRRFFSVFNESYTSLQLPILYISPQQDATVQEAEDMHGFNIQEVTPTNIILSIDNPQKKALYEIFLFSKKFKNFFKKEYILASDKKEAVSYSKKFLQKYKTAKIKIARRIDCYPILDITENKIILDRKI